jgi:hypothetical protein
MTAVNNGWRSRTGRPVRALARPGYEQQESFVSATELETAD